MVPPDWRISQNIPFWASDGNSFFSRVQRLASAAASSAVRCMLLLDRIAVWAKRLKVLPEPPAHC